MATSSGASKLDRDGDDVATVADGPWTYAWLEGDRNERKVEGLTWP